jgi:hypothetical protein
VLNEIETVAPPSWPAGYTIVVGDVHSEVQLERANESDEVAEVSPAAVVPPPRKSLSVCHATPDPVVDEAGERVLTALLDNRAPLTDGFGECDFGWAHVCRVLGCLLVTVVAEEGLWTMAPTVGIDMPVGPVNCFYELS